MYIEKIILKIDNLKYSIPIDVIKMKSNFSYEEENSAIKTINSHAPCINLWPKYLIRLLSFSSQGLWLMHNKKIQYIEFDNDIYHIHLIKAIFIALQRSYISEKSYYDG